ncbi:MAG: hypothetical protein V2I41_13695, partial [Pseudomonadales bacterium]|nr:hypothetical protein [Pseudomonadales bacterium]
MAARRALFRSLMRDEQLPATFSWYGTGTPGACPPKSLFVQLLVAVTVAGLATGGAWLLGYLPPTPCLAMVPLL